MRYVLLPLLLVLTGCTTTWTRPGLTLAEWNRDDYACDLAASGIPAPPNAWAPNLTPGAGGWTAAAQSGTALQNSGGGLMHAAHQARLYDRCMEARGYRKE